MMKQKIKKNNVNPTEITDTDNKPRFVGIIAVFSTASMKYIYFTTFK